MNSAVWLTWERQRRNASMASLLGVEYCELISNKSRLLRYCGLIKRTFGLLRAKRPKLIFYQNPSIVLSIVVVLYKILSLREVVIVGDYHNGGLFPPKGAAIVPFLIRHTNLVLVSNDNLVETIHRWGGEGVAFPDPLPDIVYAGPDESNARPQVLFICSWADDEPINEVINAGMTLPEVDVLITGKVRLDRCPAAGNITDNIKLTGFLPEADFERLLGGVDLIMDLTTRDDCMVCGAYEAVSVGKPVILSDNPVSKRYFERGVLFTNNTSTDIALKIADGLKRISELEQEVGELREKLRHDDLVRADKLAETLDVRLVLRKGMSSVNNPDC